MKKMLYALLFLILAGGLVLYLAAPHLILRPYRAGRVQLGERPGFIQVEITSAEGYRLAGAHYPGVNPRGVLVFLHGIGSSKEVYGDLMQLLADRGIASYAFDNRGQGASQGTYVTYGWYERDDLRRIADLAKAQYPGVPLGIWGNSLGGAIALQVLADDSDTDRNWDFGIVESTFAHLDEITDAYQRRLAYGIGNRWMNDRILARAGRIAGFPPDSIRPARAAARIKVPVFHAHGDADRHIALHHARRIHENLRHPKSEFHVIAGADHSGLYTAGGEDYFQALMTFIEAQISPQTLHFD